MITSLKIVVISRRSIDIWTPEFKYDSVPNEPNADRGKEKPTHRLEAARVQEHRVGSPFGSSVHPASHLRPTVSRSPFSNPHTAARHPPTHPTATSPTSRRLPAPPPDMPLRSSSIDPAAPIASRGREHFVALPSRVQRRRRHPEFTAGVSLPSSPPASPSFFNLCERAALSPVGAVAVTSAAEAPLPPSDLLSELSFTAEKARYPELTFTGGYPRRRKGPSPTGFLLAWESRPAVT
ncbi:hypothetical protein PVAP13_3NG267300 [Panicum virgatum]|uniref:Uncharacterized protein n=1 Tax=Panicum virgatum TaxID=38727 RepID=A0A8T0UPY2_PANVG|nr:hypothetical protein PVAP13_3NG267300 [Panicum virgatum]KAG2622374.1 hypothetical protein PVAP13_3NG267300 [Panicum virgatum]KAG2622375.1 hypothetical protein PVAP13_3NG267300 [Panicum virgatum]KAG2622376.1 hypothetical protein PVAP13_3NG267300 [Panicum virgatum]KAG2622377.1 hypothetical protein PVAP13_3NG267300 [Panicum virgatum]